MCRVFKRTLVFCNTVKSCRAAEFGLREVDIPALAYHGEVPSDERTGNLERFKAGNVDYLVSKTGGVRPEGRGGGGAIMFFTFVHAA